MTEVHSRHRGLPRIAGLALMFASSLSSASPPDATAYQVTVDHAGVTTSGGVLTLQETPRWSVQLPGPISYPIIAEGGVFVTSVAYPGAAYGTRLYALNARTGEQLWAPVDLVGTYYWSAIAYDAGTLFALNFDGLLRTFSAATGLPGWSVQLPGQYAFSAAPTASNGVVYVSGAGTGGTLYAVDETNGAILWARSVANGDQSSPAIGSNGVYVSYSCPNIFAFDFGGNPLWHYPDPATCSGGGGKTGVYAGGRLYARDTVSGGLILDTSTGQLVGSFPGGTAPAITATTGYYMHQGNLLAVDLATNVQKWSFAGDGTLTSAPLVVDQTVIVGSGAGRLYGVDAATGHVNWQVATGDSIPGPDEQNVSQPLTGLAAANGILVVPASNTLFAYSLFGPPPAPTGLTATGQKQAVLLNWTAAVGAASYNVYMGTASGAENPTPVQTGISGTSVTIKGLTRGTMYYFTVKAVNPDGISSASNEASAMPTARRHGGGGALDGLTLSGLLGALALVMRRRRGRC
jgi:outer membrane protein assembly factor BamB